MSKSSSRLCLFALIDGLFQDENSGQSTISSYSYAGVNGLKALQNDHLFLAAVDEVKRKFTDYKLDNAEIAAISAKCKNSRLTF